MKHIIGLILMIVCVFGLNAQSTVEYAVEVSGACGMCTERIESVALGKGKAESASYDLDTQTLTVSIDEEKTSISRVRYEISLAGHDSGKFIAPDEVYDNLPGCCQYRSEGAGESHEDHQSEIATDVPDLQTKTMKNGLTEYIFPVSGACGMCQDRIEKTAKDSGAKQADWEYNSGLLTITLNAKKYKVEDVRAAIAEAGHDSGKFITPDEVYNNLPGCCQYRSDEAGDQHPDHQMGDGANELKDHLTEGFVSAKNENGDLIPLIGATISLNDGALGTITDMDGHFVIENPNHLKTMTISYIGYEPQTFEIEGHDLIEVVLADGVNLETVEITYKKRTTEISFVKTINSEKITRDELCKAACCNLSESFETNPSVDISYNDAVTGTTQIQMLGLAGPYVQINRELIPDIRGMNNALGLNMTPGPWIQSIQLVKGTGSVVNGFESIAGQINVELKKPHEGEILHVNGYVNNGGRLELNTNARTEVSENISTNILFHSKYMQGVHDRNEDGFTDMPRERDYLFVNRWNLKQTKDFIAQVGVKLTSFDHSGGSHDHFAGTSEAHESHWQMYNDTKRNEVWGKLGYIFPNKPESSVGLQWSLVDHKQETTFGERFYDNEQQSVYANLIYQNIFDNGHMIRTGLSYQLDDIQERVTIAGVFNRSESVPGAYAEYTFKREEDFAIITGLRVDHHNNYGTFVTPRLHAKYNFSDRSIIRLTAGSGLRTANVFAENMGIFATSRLASVGTEGNGNPYNLDAEKAWNYGINLTHAIDISNKEMIFALDLYRTDFVNQVVVDLEDPRKVDFYNLDGKSYSNSLQAKIDYELFKNFDLRAAYRLFDVQTSYDGDLQEKPFVSKHRAFLNMAYKTESDWHFDTTINWRGAKRLPSTAANPIEYQRPDYSPAYFILNAQIMKRWNDVFDIYLGAENLLNYKQRDAIIAGDDAFGEYFDASIVWAPLFGSNIYLGFRYNLVKS